MQNSQNKKSLKIILFVLIAVLTLGIGYASISAINLIISGNATASVNDNNFKVYFVNTGDTPSITKSNESIIGSASISNTDNTVAMFDVSGLTKVGDYAIATYTILNNSNSIGADISLYLTNSNSEYFKVTETVTDTILQAGDTTTGSIKVELIKTPIDNDVSTSVTGTLKANAIENDTATGLVPKSKASDDPVSFSTDSWATIQKAVRNNNTDAYNVGDTRTIKINGKDYTLRLANKTTGEHCGDEDISYSQTACGFVVEFADIITTMQMRDSATNVGGYPATLVYNYLNNTLLGQLPNDLQTAIKPTRVISGYGCINGKWNSYHTIYTCYSPDNNGNNFSSIDYIYLLSDVEIYGSDLGGNNFWDTAFETTNQLEYYRNNGVTYSTSNWKGKNLDKAIKRYYLSYTCWYWLRQDGSSEASFHAIDNNGMLYGITASNTNGVAPAFRIG